jgi:hypothetical protein
MPERISRRTFFVLTAVGGLAVAGALLNQEGVVSPPIDRNHGRRPFGEPEKILSGSIIITEGANIRDYPAIPGTPALRIPGVKLFDNKLPWNGIERVNGVELKGAKLFRIDNAPLVEGEDVVKGVSDTPEINWITLSIKRVNQPYPSRYFVSYSPQTSYFVRQIREEGYAFPTRFDRTEGGFVKFKDSVIEPIAPQNVGYVTVYPGVNNIQELWQQRMRAKLTQELPLGRSDRRYKEVKVVPVGLHHEDILRLTRENRPISVFGLPDYFEKDGDDNPLLGYLKLDTVIRDPILVETLLHSYGAFLRSNVVGDIYSENGHPIQYAPNRVLVTSDEHLLTTQVR